MRGLVQKLMMTSVTSIIKTNFS